MRKGISTVIAVLLMLIIVIALVGLSYGYISGVFTSRTATAFSIVDAYGDTVTIRNDGTQSIDSFSSVTVDGNPATYLVTAQDSSLVGYWKTDENSGNTAKDSSGFGNDGTMSKNVAVITDDSQTAFWTFIQFGSGSVSTTISDDIAEKQEGADSLKIDVVSGGTFSTWLIRHFYSPRENWSDKDFISFWWYGQNTGSILGVVVVDGTGASDVYYFYDNFSGWKRVAKALRNPDVNGNVNFADIAQIRIENEHGNKMGTFRVDKVIVETGPAWVDGRFGNALIFDGVNDYVSIPDSPSINLSDAITVSAWVKLNQKVAGDFEVAVSKDLKYQIYYHPTTDKYICGITRVTSGWLTINAPTAPTAGVWHHVVLTYDKDASSNNFKCYQDGVLGETSTQTEAIQTSANPLQIGVQQTTTDPFNGTMDEVKIWNRALTADEVNAMYNIGNQIKGGQLATIKIYNALSVGTHTVRICTTSMCNTAYLVIS